VFVGLAIILVVGLLAGWLAGVGRPAGERTLLGLATAQRNISAALVIAVAIGGDTVVYTLVGALTIPVVLIVLAGEIGKRAGAAAPVAATAAPRPAWISTSACTSSGGSEPGGRQSRRPQAEQRLAPSWDPIVPLAAERATLGPLSSEWAVSSGSGSRCASRSRWRPSAAWGSRRRRPGRVRLCIRRSGGGAVEPFVLRSLRAPTSWDH
jgi:hypothetical protein